MTWTPAQIKALRKHMRLSQARFAEELGTDAIRVSHWETASRKPSGISRRLLDLIAERESFAKEEGEE